MAHYFKATEPVLVASNKKISFDSQYWKGLQFPITIKEYGAVNNISFQPVKPNYFVVSAANRVEIYNSNSNELVKSFSRFHSIAYGATFRSDGKLLVTGNEDGCVRLFDVAGRVPLRSFRGHEMPVHVSQFNSMTQLFTASDDKTVRVWDIAGEETVNVLDGHEDYIRCGCASSSPNIIFTGSYDHTVRMFDTRTNITSMAVNHGCPVESILVFPSGALLISAGGNSIKVWDILQGGKHLATVSHHHKTITCLTFNHNCTRLLSGGLDRHVKVYDVSNYSVVHNIDYPGPILSMGISHDDKTLVVGMVDKMLSIRHRKQAVKDEETTDTSNIHLTQKKKFKNSFMSGQTFVPNAGDAMIAHISKQKLAKYDEYFRKFNHSKALTHALQRSVTGDSPEVTVAVLEELIRRDTIRAAVAGRKDKTLGYLLNFICKHITDMNFASILVEVTQIVIDVYAESCGELSYENILQFRRLLSTFKHEAQLQLELKKLTGCIQTIVRSNAQTIQTNINKDSKAS